jgi:hypothetical protein
LRNAFLWLLRIGAYIFHLLLSLFLLGLGCAGLLGGESNLKLGMLPWEGAALTRAIVVMGVVGIVCTLLAMAGKLRALFPLWALFVLVLMVRGFFLSSYSFADASQFRFDVWLTVAALIAFLASLSLFSKQRR